MAAPERVDFTESGEIDASFTIRSGASQKRQLRTRARNCSTLVEDFIEELLEQDERTRLLGDAV